MNEGLVVMKKLAQLLVFLILSAVLLSCGSRQTLHTAEIESRLRTHMDKAGIPGLAALTMRNGDIVGEYYLGTADARKNLAVSPETQFMLASISKPVTAASVMLLAQHGQLNLDDRADSYLPFELVHPGYPEHDITVRMLLSHTSSLSDNWDVLDSLYTLDSGGGDSPVSLKELAREYLIPGGRWYEEDSNFAEDEPGTHHEYGNINYALLGLIAETISGMPFDVLSRDELLTPAGMSRSAWMLKDADPDNLAMPYEVNEDGEARSLGHYGFATYPDGQLRSTPRDYARFLALFWNNTLFDQSTVDEFLRIQYPQVHKHQAIAWNFDEFESVLVRSFLGYKPAHTGGDPGVATIALMDPDEQSAVIVFINGYAPGFKSMKAFYLDILRTLCRQAGIRRG